jgi:hypothetical protein
MPYPSGPPEGENCGSCYFSRITRYDIFACCFNPPTTGGTALATFPPVDPDRSWCGKWSQTGAKTNVVLQTNITLSNNSTAAMLADTTGLITGRYYAISAEHVTAGTMFACTGAAAIVLSMPATANGSFPATIADSYSA